MTCLLCKHGETAPGFTVVTLHRDGATIVLKDVPADVCDNCGEFYLSREITAQVLERAEAAVLRGAEVEIVRFAVPSAA